MFSYGVHVTDNGKYNVQNPVLGADGATVLYQEQKMFLLVPDLHLQWIAFSWFWFLLCSYCIVFLPDMMLAYYYETNISYLTKFKIAYLQPFA
jgi:hypothetical protein